MPRMRERRVAPYRGGFRQCGSGRKMKKNGISAAYISLAAATAALYVVLTALSGVFGAAYGGIQLRISEALTVLPVFFPASVPGLTVGCLISNIPSALGPADIVFGTAATFTAACLSAALRKVRVRSFPLPSMLMPVLINALAVASELTLVSGADKSFTAFAVYFGEVFAGQALSVFVFGTAVLKITEKALNAGGIPDRLRYKK